MDRNESGIICTKSRLWKRKQILINIIDYMINQGYEFVELVYGEPNNFVFADEYHEIESVLKRKGFYGIRIKFRNSVTVLEINSNTGGTNNVKYDIFTEGEMTLRSAKEHISEISNIIGSSSEVLVKSGEFLEKQRKIRNIVLLVLLLVVIYFLNIHVLFLNLVSVAYTFSPILFFFLVFSLLRRRR